MSAQATEVVNRNTVVSLALAKGFVAFLPVYDAGIDFILYRESDGKTFYVQLKSRWIIQKKYIKRKISVAFPHDDECYLVDHDMMVEWGEEAGLMETDSWVKGGAYSYSKLSKAMLERCKDYRFDLIAAVAAEAARQASDE